MSVFTGVFLPTYAKLSNKAELWANNRFGFVTAGRLGRFLPQYAFNLVVFAIFFFGGALNRVGIASVGVSKSGKRLGDFLDERLFKPLRMNDTAFSLPADKMVRLAQPIVGNVAAEKFRRSLVRWQDRLFVFLIEPEASPTNNGSEQALRWSAVFRKVTNCFRSVWGAKLHADVRSVIETARRRGIGALEAILLTLRGQPLPVPA